jgi:hypothetical protein
VVVVGKVEIKGSAIKAGDDEEGGDDGKGVAMVKPLVDAMVASSSSSSSKTRSKLRGGGGGQ